MNIDIEVAKRVLSTIDAGLVSGVGDPVPGRMCVEAAVCYALGLPHGDDPGCVSPAIRKLKITLNDAAWSSAAARAAGLRRLGLAQLGSKGVINDSEFAAKVAVFVTNTSVADALKCAASMAGDKHKESLLTCAVACIAAKDVVAASAAAIAAANAASAARAAANAASDAASAAASDAARAARAAGAANAAANAASAASAAAIAAANAASAARAAANAASDAASAAASDAASDAVLSKFAEGVVQILIEMKAPGAQWLSLTEK